MFLALSITCQAWATSQEESSTPGNGLLLVVEMVEEEVVGEVGRVREDDVNLLQSELGFFLRFLFLFL